MLWFCRFIFAWWVIFHVVLVLLCLFIPLILFELILVCSLENLILFGEFGIVSEISTILINERVEFLNL